ncbi:hypothetical protein AB0442_24860 [Kitasatospora sp. NPDC085895]|uniref:hypothetical protein n=1 Tax=Kitasatospora sp. NPDC085895 TaxID=3155057 RepID=UPI00344B2C8C
MAEPQVCPGCAGQRGTEKVQHTVEADGGGGQVHREHRYWSPCGRCGGAGVVYG